MPRTAANTRSELADRNQMPIRSVAGNGQVVTLTLRFANAKQYKPEDLFDALETKFGAGKITTDRDTQAGRNTHLQFVISP